MIAPASRFRIVDEPVARRSTATAAKASDAGIKKPARVLPPALVKFESSRLPSRKDPERQGINC